MKSFADNAGRTWLISINVTAVKRCRALAKVDLYGLVDKKFEGLGNLLGDPIALVDVIYVLCQDEADKLGISDEDFGRAMAGDAIEHATNAFLEELTDFFPDPRVRAGLTKVIQAGRKVLDRVMQEQEIRINALDVDSVAKTLIDSFGSLRVSSVSTPDLSPSANLP